MTSATLDTSVYIRALHFGGTATVIIGHARAGNIRVDISDAIVAETIRVLRDKVQWDGYSVQDARGRLLEPLEVTSRTLRLQLHQDSRHAPRASCNSRRRHGSAAGR